MNPTHTILPTVMGGTNFVLHSAGWMEGGLVADYAKLLLDADQLTMMPKLVNGIDLSENGQALDALRETGPGQHFLGSTHTQANFEDARSGVRKWQITQHLSNGHPKVRLRAMQGPVTRRSKCWLLMKPRQWIRQLMKSCVPILIGVWKNYLILIISPNQANLGSNRLTFNQHYQTVSSYGFFNLSLS